MLNTLQAIEGEVPTQFRSCLSDWSYDAGILAYQGHVFLPDGDNIRCNIVKLHHTIRDVAAADGPAMVTQQLDTPVI